MTTTRLKKGSFRMAHKNLWRMIRGLGKEAHREALVMLFLETSPLAHYTGLYQTSIYDGAAYCCMSPKEVENALHGLAKRGLIVYDDHRQFVYVRGMAARQLGTNEFNDKNLQGIAYYAERLPEDSPAVQAFVADYSENYPEIADFFNGWGEVDDAS